MTWEDFFKLKFDDLAEPTKTNILKLMGKYHPSYDIAVNGFQSILTNVKFVESSIGVSTRRKSSWNSFQSNFVESRICC